MDETITIPGFTVILIKHNTDNGAAQMNWWLSKSKSENGITVSGIPAYVGETSIRKVLSQCGSKVKGVDISVNGPPESHLPKYQLTTGYKQAEVYFSKASGAKTALSMKYDGNYTLFDEKVKLTPMTHVWRKDLQNMYNIDTVQLAKKCSDYMEEYDKKKSEEEKGARKLADEPDEDGWITVTRNKFSRPPKAVKAHELKKFKKKKQATALVHFYKNQIADSKMQKIRELKAKFEEDKKRIQEMRQQRKFKPY